MNWKALIVGTLALVGGALAVAAQQAGGIGARIVAARQANVTLMQQYTWDCRTELFESGTLKDVRIDQVQYGAGGGLQRQQINNQAFNQPQGFFRRIVAQDQMMQLENYLKGLRGLLDQYTLSSAGKIDAFIGNATVESVQSPDGTPLLKVQGSDVVVPGDAVSIWAVAATHKMRRVEISTFYEGGPATITATYKTNPAGLTYLSMGEVTVPAKNVSIQVHNYDYVPND